MNYTLVPLITTKGYPTTSKKYPNAHRKANEAEKKRFGVRRFKALTKIIQKRTPIGELAGSHTKTGKIRISKKIPKEYRAEIKFHELKEHKFMR